MATDTIKLRAKEANGVVTVKALITHPMETGARKDQKTGELVPAEFIQEVTCEHNGKVNMTSQWSGAISKNPYFSYEFAGVKGDKVKLSWVDNKGASDSAEAAVE